MIIENKLNNLINSNIDTLVYGCTHFSLLHEHIKPYFKNINYISSKMPTANYVYIYLRSQDLLNKQKIVHKVKIKTTYNKRKIKKQIKLFKIKKYRISKINI